MRQEGAGVCQPGGAPVCTTDVDCGDSQKCVGAPKWNANPGDPGYGLNSIVSSTKYVSQLQPLARECGTCAVSGDSCTEQDQCAAGNCSVSTGTACRGDLQCPAGACNVTPNSCRVDADCPSGEACLGAQTCLSLEACNLGGTVNSLNTNLGSPDADTLFDFVGAWVPVAYISNRGTGVENVKYSEMQHLFATGRMPNGENLVAATRSVGSGTRNAIMNSTGIDTSWGRGDNVGNENALTNSFNLGTGSQQTNGEGSSQVENAVEQWRLGLGYTGFAGNSRAVSDMRAGRYEVLNICNDVDANGNPLCDCTAQACPAGSKFCSKTTATSCTVNSDCPSGETCVAIDAATPNSGYVRPSISTVLDNCNACCGYQIGGSGSFVTRGDPKANLSPPESANPALDNQAVADYLNNVSGSIEDFVGNVFGKECQNTRVCSVTTATSCLADVDCPLGETCRPKSCTSDGNCTRKTCSVTGVTCAVDLDCPAATQTCLAAPGGNCSINSDPCDVDSDCNPVAQTCRADFCKSNLNSPGQFLATSFFLPAGVDCKQSLTDGMVYNPTSPLNQALQNFIRTSNDLQAGEDTPPFGSINPATGGRTPKRNSLTGSGQYSEGSVTGSYVYWNGSGFVTNFAAGTQMSVRNKIQGDFNEDGLRNLNDATEMVKAYYVPRSWQQSDAQATGSGSGSALGGMTFDNAIPEVIGDFDGEGNFTKEDLRYFVDGLAMSGGRLDRKGGAIAMDNAFAEWGRCVNDPSIPCRIDNDCVTRGVGGTCDLTDDYLPWADPSRQLLVPPASLGQDPTFMVPKDVNDPASPFLKTGATYKAGDFRADVAGQSPVPGAQPVGWDGFVDQKDITYCCRMARIGSWSNLNDAVYMDLSCDMNGDLEVNNDDVLELVGTILETVVGDVDLDGDYDAVDLATIQSSINGPNPCNADRSCGYEDGDLTCDGVVTEADLALVPILPEPSSTDKNRYISFVVAPSSAGQETAIRVQLASLNHVCSSTSAAANKTCASNANCPGGTCLVPFAGREGEYRYVNAILDGNNQPVFNCPDSQLLQSTFKCARLGCAPEYRDWAALTAGQALHVTGDSVVPSSIFRISSLPQAACQGNEALCLAASAEVEGRTAQWGDVDGSLQVNVLDVSKLVDKVKDLATGTFIKPRTQMQPSVPSSLANTNVLDIANGVDALKSKTYPFSGPSACP